jgi:outer membrane protein
MRLITSLTLLVLVTLIQPGLSEENPENRSMSLKECIQMALDRNLDVQILRYSPRISKYEVAIAYANYDPLFSFSANKYFDSSQGFTEPTYNIFIPERESYVESFGPRLSGQTPIGMTYALTGNLRRDTGTGYRDMYQYYGTAGIELTQPLLKDMWIDGTRLQIKISKNNLKISELSLRQQIMTTVTSVQFAYADLIAAREGVKVQETALKLAEKLLDENRKRVEVGAMAPLDEKQAESQVAARQANLISAKRLLSASENVLKKLLSDDFVEWKDVGLLPTEDLKATPMVFSRLDSWQKGTTMRPDILQKRLTLQNSKINVSYSKNQLFPSLNVSASFGLKGADGLPGILDGHASNVYDYMGSADYTRYSIGAVFSIPLTNTRARKNYRISKAQREQAILDLKRLEQNILVEIDDAIKQAEANLQRVKATENARGYSEAALEAEEKKLENGKSTSFFVLQLQNDLTTARSEEIRALADYNKSLAQLALSEGSTLDSLNIELDMDD